MPLTSCENLTFLLRTLVSGVLDRLGLGYDAMQEINPSLVYCALKGFLSGPYEQRAALDEVVQMMGGLAYRGDLSSMRKLGMFEDSNLEHEEKVFQIDSISIIMGKLLS